MQAKDLALALSVITRAYPAALMVKPESGDISFIVIEMPDKSAMRMALKLEEILEHLGFKYSDSHGACWYGRL